MYIRHLSYKLSNNTIKQLTPEIVNPATSFPERNGRQTDAVDLLTWIADTKTGERYTSAVVSKS
jgi:hypothetical protein